ncbi:MULTISPECIES: ribose-phosphate pyrophosphokinase [Acidianus]|uniref:Ribose-phosphate pyrophosphokinase n=1 Tax=Candidatus Acidianus copahuensis TaxID=1160895 RepID=A0A031LQC5_9CREN|nr:MULTISPECIES: ribose-phosphate pyrophosphokinase [Acidianus]EZQ06935.1 ribose-phosphate pyrophosphokinase [Candidatus Acidianus copahuensis]NON62176.1 ribose-phosphate pyrophosphokinase [Acidianus sp. RZ1]
MIVIGGTASNSIDDKVAKILGSRSSKVESKLFPDGESYIRIPIEVKGEEVVIIQSTYYPQDKHWMELFFMIETLKDLGAEKVISVIPYLGYARQNRRFKDGEALSLKTVLDLLYRSGSDELITVEPHDYDTVISFFKGKVKIVDPVPTLAKELKKITSNPFVIAPDKGALSRAERMAKELEAPFSFIEKERDRNTGEVRVKYSHISGVENKDVIIVDDIISTGGTMAQASRIAYEKGAKSVIASAAHVLLIGDAKDKLSSAGIREIIGTNTVIPPETVKVVDVSELIAVRI